MKKVLFLFLIGFSFVVKAQHPNYALAEKKFEEGYANERKYYVNFNQEYFVNSYTAYQDAANLYLDALKKCVAGEKIYASYHAMKCLYAEAEVFDAMETPKKIYDLYVLNFDKLIADSLYKSCKQSPHFNIKKELYDSLWTSTLDILYKSSVKAKKELYAIKCGSMLLKHLPKTSHDYFEILYEVAVTTAKIGDADNLLRSLKLWVNKSQKPYHETERRMLEVIEIGVKDHPDSFSEEQLKELEEYKKKMLSWTTIADHK